MKKFSTTFAALILTSLSFSQVPSTWYQIPSGTTNNLRSIDFPTSTTGYIVGDSATILKTTDGGQTWLQLPTNGIQIIGWANSFLDIDFVDENSGFLTAGYSGIYKTTDGGQNWFSMTGQISNMCFPHTIYPFSSDDFFSGGAGCFQGAIIDHFENGSWTTSTLAAEFWDSEQRVQEISFANQNVGLAATKSKYMLRTTDAGATWDTIAMPLSAGGFLTSVVMVNDQLCYAGYDDNGFGSGVLWSSDGGLTWEYDFNSATFFYPAFLNVHAAANGDIYSGAISSISPGGLIFETSDGTNWSNATVDNVIHSMTSYAEDVTFGVGDSGYIIVNVPLSELSLDQNETMEIQFFPNPVVEELTVVNSENAAIELQLMDGFGKLIFSGVIPQGETIIDCSELCTGIYFIRLKNENLASVHRFVKN